MKNTVQKIVSLFLTMVLVCSLAVFAIAEDASNGHTDVSSTITVEPPTQIVDPPVDPDEPPVIPDEPPVDPDAPPVDPDEPPVDPDAPPVDPDAPPIDPDAPPVDPDAPPIDPDAPPVDPDAPPVDPDAPPVPPDVVNSVSAKIYNGTPTSFQYGDMVTLEAVITGYLDVSYTITWEYCENGYDWLAAEGENHTSFYQFELTEENVAWGWRAAVDVV